MSPHAGTYGLTKFENDKTTFSFTCPAKLFDASFIDSNVSYEDFEVPKNVHAIAIDDSKIQRKILSRFFLFAGIPEDRIHIMGGTAEEIKGFCDWAITFVDEHPDDFVLMIVDENLDVQEEELRTKQLTVSGSGAVAEMRKRLLPDQERRVLSLIRSANDSASDVAIYNSRAHGYLPKAPFKKELVLEVLAPLWLARFPRFEIDCEKKCKRSDSVDDLIVTMDDLMGLIDDIDSLSMMSDTEVNHKWPIIWEKMHALKGDLQIMPNKRNGLETAITLITQMRGPEPPDNFVDIWVNIRSKLLR